MKKIIAIFAVLFTASSVTAEVMTVIPGVEMRLQAIVSDSSNDEDIRWRQRFKVGTELKSGEHLSGKLTFVHNAIFGGPAAGGTAADAFRVNEAYATWMATDSFQLRVGRMADQLNDGDIISSNDYEDYLTAVDGFAASYEMEKFRWKLWYNSYRSPISNEVITINGLVESTGTSLTFKSLPNIFNLAELFVSKNKLSNGEDVENYIKYGLVAGGNFSRFDWNLTYATERGKAADDARINTRMLDAELSWTIGDASWSKDILKGSRVFVGYHTDSGASEDSQRAYYGYLYDRHNNAGGMDLIGWGNLTYYKAGVDFQPMEGLQASATYYGFSKTEKAGSLVSKGTGLLEVAGEGELGSELDLSVSKMYANGLNLVVAYRMFSFGDALTLEGSDKDKINQVWFQAKMNF